MNPEPSFSLTHPLVGFAGKRAKSDRMQRVRL